MTDDLLSKGPDMGLVQWARERNQERNRRSQSAVLQGRDPFTREPLEAWTGIEIRTEDDDGSEEVRITIRPLLLGDLEFSVRVASKAASATRPHRKAVYLTTDAASMRKLAQRLLVAADAADEVRRKLKPRPVE